MATESPATTSPAPAIPLELWMLWANDAEDEDRAADAPIQGWWLTALDSIPEQSLLVYTSQAEAQAGATYQNEMYWINSVPVRVK